MANSLKSIFLLTILISVTYGNYQQQEEDTMLRYVIKLLSSHPKEYSAFWDKVKDASNGRIEDTRKYIPMPFDDTCTECGTFIDGVKTLVGTIDINIAKFLLTPLCIGALNAQGSNGNIICPNVIENYAYHVFFIFGNLNITGRAACELLHLCSSSILRSDKFSDENQWKFLENFAHIQRAVPVKALPNLSSRFRRQSNNVIKVAHLTDIHVEDKYVDGSPTECDLFVCCQNDGNGTSGSAHPYGDYNCNLPPKTVEKFLDFVAAQDPDIIIYTGDSPSHALWTETLERQRDLAKWVADSIAQRIQGIPAFPAFGNHENFPTNMFYAPDADVQTLMDSYYQSWKNLSNFGTDQENTIKTAGYYYIDSGVLQNIKIVSINSNYGYTDNWYNLINDVEPGYIKMKEQIEQAMEDARTAGQKVLLLVHHNSGGNVLLYDEWITQIYVTYRDIILMAFSGHTHSDHLQLIYDAATGSPAVSHFTAPSMDSHGGHNPGARIFHFDAATMTPMDYEQYRIDLNELIGNPNVEPNVTLLYKASEVYGLDDLTPNSIHELVTSFETDDQLFNKYWSYRSVRPENSGTCVDTCKTSEICRIKSSTIEQRRECEGSGTEPVTTTVSPTTTTGGAASQTTSSVAAVSILFLYTFFFQMF